VSTKKIYIEGGGDSKELDVRCREGFRRLLEKCGFAGRMPRLVACGSRESTFNDFSTAHANTGNGDYLAMLVDCEAPVADLERTWAHLQQQDAWSRPHGADDEQVLLMTTCMETWIATDRQALKDHYGMCLQESALPNLDNMETRGRDDVQDALVQATRTCRTGYRKGRRSFELAGKLDPSILRENLPSFRRCQRVLDVRL
jgi:hypothetical protein